MTRTKTLLAALATAGLLAGSAQAGLITGVTATSNSEEIGFGRLAIKAVDGTGMTSATTHSNSASTMWMSEVGQATSTSSDVYLLIDLGAVYAVDSFTVWNYNEDASAGRDNTRGVNAVVIEYGTSVTGSDIDSAATLAGVTNFARASPNRFNNFTGELFDPAGSFTARFIKINVDSNHGGNSNVVGLAEIQFTAVPEPSSLSLLALGGLLVARRRRG